MKMKSILKNLKTKKISVYVRNLGQYSQFRGVLKEITEEIIVLMARYNKTIYIPISEIVVVIENEVKSETLKEKLANTITISSVAQN